MKFLKKASQIKPSDSIRYLLHSHLNGPEERHAGHEKDRWKYEGVVELKIFTLQLIAQ